MSATLIHRYRLFTSTLILFLLLTSPNLKAQHQVPLDQWVRDYVEDLCKPDWRNHMAKFGWVSNYERHQAFRNAYQNLEAKVMRSVTNGKEVMAWLTVSAIWSGNLKGDILENVPIGKKVEWEEVWYFNVIDGKLGGKWDLMHDNLMKMKSTGIKCLPSTMD